MSSIGHRSGSVRLHDYNFDEPGRYSPRASYGQAKIANIWFANEIERRYGSRNLHATSLHPGGIVTGLRKYIDLGTVKSWGTPAARVYMKSPAQGAATSVYAAVSKEQASRGSKYLSNCEEQGEFEKQGKPQGRDDGYKLWAYGEEREGRLWKDSLKMVGLEGGE